MICNAGLNVSAVLWVAPLTNPSASPIWTIIVPKYTRFVIASLAFSIVGQEPYHFGTAGSVAQNIAKKVLKMGLPEDTLLNINVPNLKSSRGVPVVFTRQGKRVYTDSVKETKDPWGRAHYWIGGGTPSWDNAVDTDSRQVINNNISITPIHLDLTNYEALEFLQKNWS